MGSPWPQTLGLVWLKLKGYCRTPRSETQLQFSSGSSNSLIWGIRPIAVCEQVPCWTPFSIWVSPKLLGTDLTQYFLFLDTDTLPWVASPPRDLALQTSPVVQCRGFLMPPFTPAGRCEMEFRFFQDHLCLGWWTEFVPSHQILGTWEWFTMTVT